MPKATWGAIEGSPDSDDLDNIAIYDGEMPPKGIYRLRLKMLRLKENSNGDMMLNGLVIVNEPSGSKKVQYNGYDTWFNLNITKQGARWVNNFLSALFPEGKVAAIRKAFWAQKVMIDKEDPANILSIGGVKITEDMLISAQLAYDPYGEGAMKPKRFLRAENQTLNEDDGYDATDAEEDEEGYEEPDEEELPDDEEDEEFEARGAELDEMDRRELLKIAKGLEISVKRGTSEEDIVTMILEAEFPEDAEEDDEELPDDEDEEPAEEDEEVAEEEPEEEPEPPARTRRTRAAAAKAEPAKPAARTRRAAAAKEAEPPARTRTGRRRKAGSGEPPF